MVIFGGCFARPFGEASDSGGRREVVTHAIVTAPRGEAPEEQVELWLLSMARGTTYSSNYRIVQRCCYTLSSFDRLML